MSNLQRFTKDTIRTKWVREWCINFLSPLIDFDNKEQLENYCKEKKDEFITLCQEQSTKRAKERKEAVDENSWRNSAASNMTGIRKAIEAWQCWAVENLKLELTGANSYPQQTKRGVVNQHLALLYMNFDSGFHKQRLEPSQVKKQQQRRYLEPINCIDEYQETIEKLLKSSDYRELTIGLIAATGRRPSEILKTAHFTQKAQFEINFSGQLKAKGETQTYPTFTLIESAQVVDGLLRLRRMPEIKELKRKTLAQIDSGRNSTVNSKVVEYFAPLIKPPFGEIQLSAKNLRASYAAISIYLFCPWEQSTNQFITERLGHANDSTATYYEDYQVVDNKGKPLTHGAWLERIGEEMSPTKQCVQNVRLRITQSAREKLDDKDFLPYPDVTSRFEELVRLAEIGKQFEEGKLVNEVVKVVEKIVEIPIKDSAEVDGKTSLKAQNFTHLSNAELLGSHTPYSASEKLKRAVEAIKTYNEGQPEKKNKWAINTTVLKQLTNCRTQAIEKFLKSDEGRLLVKDYNSRFEFGYHQNRGKGKITDVLKLA